MNPYYIPPPTNLFWSPTGLGPRPSHPLPMPRANPSKHKKNVIIVTNTKKIHIIINNIKIQFKTNTIINLPSIKNESSFSYFLKQIDQSSLPDVYFRTYHSQLLSMLSH